MRAVRPILPMLLLSVALASSCKRETHAPERQYQLSGRVVSLDARHQIATIDAAAIPNFMEAMTMEYPVKSKSDFDRLHVGDTIQATVNVGDSASSEYYLSNIRKQSAQKQP